MAKVRSRKQDIAWQYLFDRFDIPNQIEKYGGFEITSSDINKYVREYYANRPALMLDLRTDFSLPCKLIAEEHFLYDSIFTRI